MRLRRFIFHFPRSFLNNDENGNIDAITVFNHRNSVWNNRRDLTFLLDTNITIFPEVLIFSNAFWCYFFYFFFLLLYIAILNFFDFSVFIRFFVDDICLISLIKKKKNHKKGNFKSFFAEYN